MKHRHSLKSENRQMILARSARRHFVHNGVSSGAPPPASAVLSPRAPLTQILRCPARSGHVHRNAILAPEALISGCQCTNDEPATCDFFRSRAPASRGPASRCSFSPTDRKQTPRSAHCSKAMRALCLQSRQARLVNITTSTAQTGSFDQSGINNLEPILRTQLVRIRILTNSFCQ